MKIDSLKVSLEDRVQLKSYKRRYDYLEGYRNYDFRYSLKRGKRIVDIYDIDPDGSEYKLLLKFSDDPRDFITLKNFKI